jgi:DNA polymerase II large subunit
MKKQLTEEERKQKREYIKELVALTTEYMEVNGDIERVVKLSNIEEPYSFRNSLLIRLQRPEATICAGFLEWKKQGRSVRKGEAGSIVLVPLVIKNDKEGEDKIRFKTDYVFDISQTEEVKA